MAAVNITNLFKDLTGEETIEELRKILNWERRILYTILDHLPSSVYVKDYEARKILANKANYQQAGFEKAEDVIGKTDFEMFPRHLAEKFYEDDCRVLKNGESITNRVEQVIATDGKERWQVTEKYPIYDDEGGIVGLFGFGHDITAQKNLEKEKTLASKKIEEQRDMVEQMIVDLSAIPVKIENLVDGIANIAKQTKMVAINAAIEAARVGEYGRGFEIVAREVGQLSDQSQKATIQVREAIEEVNSLVQKILQLWEEVKQEK
ncbi:MAG: methyl-accepting chemotaxis protein [Limnochordia bacterium]|jgi:PAS domain S-box-containing protein|nr:methyl-accepting chemotaxis protein [Limnochordia bacterium]HPT92294.1 methyl-accepting chemotaxis protein [Limnochordia bacterium]HPZ30328.1 methyl-accepting chemotaxis protein [Limnochordia bacterium]HQD69862.1 methyl-accepting chemotaxis protein [Limnochordia bacterium]HXK97197.1 methyl-accepting chemotaxis protein [Limnochordia bacterium]